MRRRAFISGAVALATLGACQMRPVLAPYQGQQLRMQLPDPGSRVNFLVNRSLLERINHDPQTTQKLTYSVSSSRRSVGTRDQIHAKLSYQLRDHSDPENLVTLSEGTVQALVSFRDAGGTLTELVAENDGTVRYTAILADRMYDKIARDLQLRRATP